MRSWRGSPSVASARSVVLYEVGFFAKARMTVRPSASIFSSRPNAGPTEARDSAACSSETPSPTMIAMAPAAS